jgi:hypothetical protein
MLVCKYVCVHFFAFGVRVCARRLRSCENNGSVDMLMRLQLRRYVLRSARACISRISLFAFTYLCGILNA